MVIIQYCASMLGGGGGGKMNVGVELIQKRA